MEKPETIKLIIPGEPKAQERHRSVIMPRKNAVVLEALNKTNGKTEKFYRKKDLFMHNYDPSWKVKKCISRMIGALAPEIPLTGPVRVDRFYYFAYLKSHYGTGKNAGKVKASAPVHKATEPDIDNFDKLLFDVLNGLFVKNDGQIALGAQGKFYSTVPRTEVFITPLGMEGGKEGLEGDLENEISKEPEGREKQKLPLFSH